MDKLPVCRNCGAQFIAPVKFCELCGTPVIPPNVQVIVKKSPDAVPVAEPEPDLYAGPEPEPAIEHEQAPEPAEPDPEFVDLEPDVLESPHEDPEPEPEPEKPSPVRRPTPAKAKSALPADPLSPAFSGLSDGPEKAEPAKTTGARPPVNKALIGVAVVILFLITAVYFIGLPLLEGGTPLSGASPQPVPVNTPVLTATTLPATIPTTVSTPVPAATADPYVPLPTQDMPKYLEVYFQAQKDPVTSQVTVIFAGGPGINLIRTADVRVTRSDGKVVTGTILPGEMITEITLDGTKYSDRVEVIANMHNGQSFRVIDELLVYKKW
jgi:hypothetical protein